MDGLTWERVCTYFYRRRGNKSPEFYYKRKFEDIKSFFENKPITYEVADQFLEWLEEDFMERNNHPISNAYYNKYLTVLKVCAKLCGANFSEYSMRNEQEDAVETERLTQEEYQRLLKQHIPYVRDEEYINFRDKLIIEVTVQTAQRIGNIRGLQWSDYRNGYFYIRMTKNGRPHKVYLQPYLQEKLKKLRTYEHNFIFGNFGGAFDLGRFNKVLKEYCRLAKIHKNITGKSLRKTGATAYLKGNTPLHKVAKITNHRDVRVLANHYYDPEDGELEEIIEDNPFHPEPYTTERIIDKCNEFQHDMIKREVQVVLVPQNNNIIITVPLNKA